MLIQSVLFANFVFDRLQSTFQTDKQTRRLLKKVANGELCFQDKSFHNPMHNGIRNRYKYYFIRF